MESQPNSPPPPVPHVIIPYPLSALPLEHSQYCLLFSALTLPKSTAEISRFRIIL